MKELFAVIEDAMIAGGMPAELVRPRATHFDPDARTYEAYSLGTRTDLKGVLAATTLDQAQAEATERWHWDRKDRLGIRETGQEDAPFWPFDKQAFDRLHVFAVQRSAPLRWELDNSGRSIPLYRYSLKQITTIDLGLFRGEGFVWERPNNSREAGVANNAPASINGD